MDYLVSFRERIGQARDLLTDKERTAFFFVTLPEALPIAVIKRFIQWFRDFGIPVGGVVVNMLIQKDQVRAGRSRVEPGCCAEVLQPQRVAPRPETQQGVANVAQLAV